MVNNIPRALEYPSESSGISIEAVQEDQEEEIESYMSAIDIEACETECEGHTQLKGNLKKASEHIIISGTQTEYRQCTLTCLFQL